MILTAVSLILFMILSLMASMIIKFKRGKGKAEEYNKNVEVQKLKNIGTTESLKVTPLIDWYTKTSSLKGEAGTSYLIETDDNKILFDLGLNTEDEHPSPLLYNMKKLNIDLDEIYTIVLSHNHADHIGGLKWLRKNTFSLSGEQIDLEGKDVYCPVELDYPGIDVECTKKPTKIGEGITTIGTIANQLILGWVEEQAIAVKLEGKGIVLIVGCGHQTIPNLIERCEELFNEPLYGIIGGLHFPVSGGRGKKIFSLIQKYMGIDELPWNRNKLPEVREYADILSKRDLKLVGLSAHDSCDKSIDVFREKMKNAYEDVRVGKAIIP